TATTATTATAQGAVATERDGSVEPMPMTIPRDWTGPLVVTMSWALGAGLAEALYFIPRAALVPFAPRDLSTGWLVCGLIGGLGLYATSRWMPIAWMRLLLVVAAVAVGTALTDAVAY